MRNEMVLNVDVGVRVLHKYQLYIFDLKRKSLIVWLKVWANMYDLK